MTNNTRIVVFRKDSADIQLATAGLADRFGETGPFAAMPMVSSPQQTVWVDRWAGPYAGFAFGAGSEHVAQTEAAASNSASGPSSNSETDSIAAAGGMAGTMNSVFAGHNRRMGDFVAGAQVEGSAVQRRRRAAKRAAHRHPSR